MSTSIGVLMLVQFSADLKYLPGEKALQPVKVD